MRIILTSSLILVAFILPTGSLSFAANDIAETIYTGGIEERAIDPAQLAGIKVL
ncbi:MAG: hypothetical protein ACO3ZG_05990 [Kiritimatiellia bacterium]